MILEQSFDAAAPPHLVGRQAYQLRRVDEGDAVGKRQGDVESVGHASQVGNMFAIKTLCKFIIMNNLPFLTDPKIKTVKSK